MSISREGNKAVFVLFERTTHLIIVVIKRQINLIDLNNEVDQTQIQNDKVSSCG